MIQDFFSYMIVLFEQNISVIPLNLTSRSEESFQRTRQKNNIKKEFIRHAGE